MKFVAREIKTNVNVSQEHPLKVFFKLLASLGVISVVVYILLVAVTEIAIQYIPQKINHALSSLFVNQFPFSVGSDETSQKVQGLLDDVSRKLDLPHADSFKVSIIDMDDKNAFIFPGGNIFITTALLNEFNSENELTMVLAHEVGHYMNNDHLRALGRAAVLGGIVAVLGVGGAGEVGQFITGFVNIFDLKYSRDQEERADKFAVDILNQYYGHASGAVSALQLIENKEVEKWTLNGFLSTHPVVVERVRYLQDLIRKRNFIIKGPSELKPLPFVLNLYEEESSEEIVELEAEVSE